MAAPMKLNDGEKIDMIATIVKNVIQVLMKGKKPPDDTIMHNLLDSLKQNVCSPEDVSKMELDVFVEEIVENSDNYDEGIVSFAISIGGWLVEETVFYSRFSDRMKKIFSSIGDKIHSGKDFETVILTSFYDSLISFTKHEQGRRWLLEERKDVIFDGLKRIVSCPSIFLEKSIIEFVYALIEQSECSAECDSIIDVIQQDIDKLLHQKSQRPFVAGPLKLLEKLCVMDRNYYTPTSETKIFNNHPDIFTTLLALFTHLDNKNSESAMRIINSVYWEASPGYVGSQRWINFVEETDRTLTLLITQGDIVKAQRIALCCMEDNNNEEIVRHHLDTKCYKLLCQPVHWLFGKVKEEEAVLSEQTLIDAMKKRSVCVNVVCLSLRYCVLPLEVVFRLLRHTIHGGEVYDACVASYLQNNARIQELCLDSLELDRQALWEDSMLRPSVRCLLDLYKNTLCDPSISLFSSRLLIGFLQHLLLDKEHDYSSIASELADIIQRHLSALKWEVRDSCLELIARIIQTYDGDDRVVVWLNEYRFPNLIWLALKDSESYVRATAISALLDVSQCKLLFQNLLETASLTQEDVVKEITHIASTDTEAFARRSAMKFLCQFYKVKVTTQDVCLAETIPKNVITTIVSSLRDFDWEVKNAGLDFVNMLFTGSLPNQTAVPDNQSALLVKKMMFPKKKSLLPKQSVLTNKKCVLPNEQSMLPNKKSVLPDKQSILPNIEQNQFVERTLTFLVDVLCYQNLAKVLMEVLNDYDDTVCEKSLNVFSVVQCYFTDVLKTQDRPSFETTLKGCYRENRVNTSGETIPCTVTDCQDSRPLETNESEAPVHKTGCDIHKDKQIVEIIDTILDTDLEVYRNKLKYSHDKFAKLVSLAEDIMSFTSNDDEEKISDCY